MATHLRASLRATVSALRVTGGIADPLQVGHVMAERLPGEQGSRAFHLTDRWADTHSLLPPASLRYGVESAL